MFECRFFTTKNCSPMGYARFTNYKQAHEYFIEHSKKFMWAYMVEIDEKNCEKVLDSFQKGLDN